MRIWDTGKATARENMAQDAFLLQNLERDSDAVLHLYDWWGDSATYGHFIKPETFFDLDTVAEKGISLAKRPTGGGIIFHSFDFTFSLAIPTQHRLYSPNTLDSYANVNREVIEVICQFLGKKCDAMLLGSQPKGQKGPSQHFCMASPTKYDVILDGKKVGGAAQRRTRFGLLHQGSISLVRPCREFIRTVLKEGESIYVKMVDQGNALMTSTENYADGRRHFCDQMKQHFLTSGDSSL